MKNFVHFFGLRKNIFLLVHIFVGSCAYAQIALMIIHRPQAGEGRSHGTVANATRVCGLFHARANSVTFCFLFNLALLLFFLM